MSNAEKSGLIRYRRWLKQVAKKHIAQELNRKLDASDIVQETLLRAHRGRATMRGKDDASIRAWLLQILANYLVDSHRGLYSGKRNIALERSIEESLNQSSENILRWIESREISPDQLLTVNEARDRVLAALDQLSLASQREYDVVIRVKFDGERLQQVADSLGISKSTVARCLANGMEKLAAFLRKVA